MKLNHITLLAILLISIVFISGCTSFKTAKFETKFKITENMLKGAEMLGQPQTYESACGNLCANSCASVNMVYSYSKLNETVLGAARECMCGCN